MNAEHCLIIGLFALCVYLFGLITLERWLDGGHPIPPTTRELLEDRNQESTSDPKASTVPDEIPSRSGAADA